MEIQTDQTITAAYTGFNGAITFSLWKLVQQLRINAGPESLQWGHNFFVMEITSHQLQVRDGM